MCHVIHLFFKKVMAYLSDLAATNPLVTTKVGGVTSQGRNIVQVGKPANNFCC